jgi:hypothetical protein
MNSFFVIPQAGGSIIAQLNGNSITKISNIDVPYHSKNVITENNLIVSLCFGSKLKSRRMKIFNTNGKQLIKKEEYKYDSINCKCNTIYFGGQYLSTQIELFSFIELSSIDFLLNEVQLPIKGIRGKSIDDILIYENKLILVDNIIVPKFLFEYDITLPNRPVYKQTKKLNPNGPYEHINKGDMNSNWTVLLSTTVGMGGTYQHLTIFGKQDAVLSFAVEEYFNERIITNSKILDICLINNKLLILKDTDICYIDLNIKVSRDNITKLTNNPDKLERILKITEGDCILFNKNKYKHLKADTFQ